MIGRIGKWLRSKTAFPLIGLTVLVAMGCNTDADPSPATPEPVQPAGPAQTITLGDIDATDPVKKIKRFTPLANYLADNLKEFGILTGNVVISRDIEEAGRYLKDGTLDIYLDSAYPTLVVQELSGSQIIARRWKQGHSSYWSTYITLRDSGIDSLDDFMGKVLAFEQPDSTSGFMLPAGMLIQQGFTLKEVASPGATVEADEIGYYFSGDEENTVALVIAGIVAGGGFSNIDYEELPEELMNKIAFIGQTISVPRQLVSVRPGLDPGLVNKVIELLTTLDQTEEGMLILKNLKNTKKFDLLPPGSVAKLQDIKALIELVTK